MELTALILEQIDREAVLTRRALERVPEGKNDWKPHEKSMPLGILAHMIATMPSWIAMIVNQNELDVAPKEGKEQAPLTLNSVQELVQAHDKAVADARDAVRKTSEAHLQTPWKLLAGGNVAMETSRYRFILDNFTHLAHHRGQLTVYLRLNGTPVPSMYGPTADDPRF
jgi:uncharacterized damage-inducible protein DinB